MPATATATTLALTTPAADTEPPTAPTNLTATVDRGKKVMLSWAQAPTTWASPGYQLYRDGKLVVTTTGTSYTDTLGGKSPTAAYYVVAFDAAGNVSVSSNAALVGL
jgi:hypothetical protein